MARSDDRAADCYACGINSFSAAGSATCSCNVGFLPATRDPVLSSPSCLVRDLTWAGWGAVFGTSTSSRTFSYFAQFVLPIAMPGPGSQRSLLRDSIANK